MFSLVKYSSLNAYVNYNHMGAFRDFPGDAVIRICLPMEEIKGTRVPSLGWEGPLGEEMATHSNILVWKIP